MKRSPIVFGGGHLPRVVEDLVSSGWRVQSIPEDGRVPRNGLRLVLKADDKELRLRIFAYKVTTSGRSRPHERRVEITTTYQSGLRSLRTFADVVLGVDVDAQKYVGIDSRRLRLGGATHNASSFFDLEGLSVRKGELLVNPRSVGNPLFPLGIELHAFFDRGRLAEYLFNHRDIHSGVYGFGDLFGGSRTDRRRGRAAMTAPHRATGEAFVLSSRNEGRARPIALDLIEAVEDKDFSTLARRRITPEQLRQIQSVCDEIGVLGEQVVLSAERRRLRGLGFTNQAAAVERVSLHSVAEGYDIVSFEDDGVTKRYLEVKTTSGVSPIVDVSRGEWQAARRLRRQYYLVRVTSIRSEPQMRYVRDPVQLEQDGLALRTPTGWKLDLRRALAPQP